MTEYDDAWTDDGVRAFLTRRLDERTPGKIHVITVPAPFAPLETFLSALGLQYRVFWAPPKGAACAATGFVWKYQLPSAARGDLTALRTTLDELFARVVHHTTDPKAPSPKVFGGVAFSPGDNVEEWADFGDGCFTLPRWTYTREDSSAFISLAYRGEENFGPEWQLHVTEEFEALYEALEAYEGANTGITFHREATTIPPRSVEQTSLEVWQEQVLTMLSLIGEGSVRKVVLARRCVVGLPSNIDDLLVLTRLSIEFPETTRFAFQRPGGTFLGATPETLFRKRGRLLTTEALAGSIRSLGSEFPTSSRQSQVLLGSSKEALEHDLVVRHIRHALGPHALEVSAAETPTVRKFRNIIHLQTGIEAQLHPTAHPVDLLSALHPTPAVAGAPVLRAIELIVENELSRRGWYAGAIGWFDQAGDAQFNVAIRCGLFRKGRDCFVYTGAGLVEGSDADAEYAETELKQHPMLRALGVIR